MLTAVRRGPASIARTVLFPSTSRRCLQSLTTGISCPKSFKPRPTSAFRAFSTIKPNRQRAALNAREDEIDDEIEEEVHSQRPPSDAQIDDATLLGPVTTFQGLSERGLVCNTVVDTITKNMGLTTMTQVQSLTINETLKGIDV